MGNVTTVVLDRTVVSIIDSGVEEGERRLYRILVDGHARGPIRLQRFFVPSIGVYDEGRFAAWCGTSFILSSIEDRPHRSVDCPEPIYAVYRVRHGWCVIGELSVFMLDEGLTIVARRMHDEIITASSWSKGELELSDFYEVRLRLSVDEDTMTLGEFTTFEVPGAGEVVMVEQDVSPELLDVAEPFFWP